MPKCEIFTNYIYTLCGHWYKAFCLAKTRIEGKCVYFIYMYLQQPKNPEVRFFCFLQKKHVLIVQGLVF